MKAGQAAVRCVACGDRYNEHETGGGPCYVVDDDGRCPCKGFRWVPVDAEPVNYRSKPQVAARGQ